MLTGGAPVHALTVDYASRPVLVALGAWHVVPGLFVLDNQIERTPGGAALGSDASTAVEAAAGAAPPRRLSRWWRRSRVAP
ncbi:MAG: hypothetical protein GEV28_39125 [Actinophytocola sp.]|uniref:hypothetical protein n=1 Tax=Actinophytocola sp. TaxID=1872138 RepID=UPI0013255C31|nr:hypothetical protein [Actinophytocola sp.]MPZ86064.1 hypothetical protein [Actinophytocola sp.]